MSSFTLRWRNHRYSSERDEDCMEKGESNLDVMAMFIGKIPGTIGEVSVIALLIGAAYLLAKKVISHPHSR